MNRKQEDWYLIKDIDELDSPALVIFPRRVKENVQTLLSMVDDSSRLRPHVKTHKTIEATKLLMQAGVNKFKCATIAEAEMLGMAGAGDVVLAYQPVGPKLKRFLCLINKYPSTKYSCLVDNEKAATEISNLFVANQKKLPVYIDLNVGQNRTGIDAGPGAVNLYIKCASSLPGIQPVGLHAYDGHIRDKEFEQRKKNCDEAFARVVMVQKEIKEKGLPEPLIIAGGSPTFSIHSKRKTIECSPGTFIYWDKGYLELCPEQDFKPAAVVVSRVISLPAPGKICIDLGHKSIAAENEMTRRVYFLNADGLKPLSQSEEHLVLEAAPDHGFQTGDVLYGIPYHVCPTIALYERAVTIEDGKITGEWKNISRDRRIGC